MLIRNNPFNLISELNKIVHRPYDYSFEESDSATENVARLPAVDIKEETDKFLLYMDIPGFDPKKIDVTMNNNLLSIKGERDDIEKEEKQRYHRLERMRGTFHRHFTLPDSADAEQIHAKIKNGVLEVSVGKKKTNEPKKIKIDLEQ